MTASRTWRSRSLRDATMSPKLLPANNLARSTHTGQVTDEGVEPKPALRRAREPLVPDLRPSPLHPHGGTGRQGAAKGGKRNACVGTQREVQALRFPLLLRQSLLDLDRQQTGAYRASVALPRRSIPATHPAVERMRGRPESEIRATRPVGRVMSRAAAVACGIRDLIEMIAAIRKPHVSKQVLLRVSLVISGGRGAARDPTGERGAFLDGEAIQGQVRGQQVGGKVQVARPVPLELTREGKNEVERDVVHPHGTKGLHRVGNAARGVRAMHPLQHPIVEGLRAQRNAIDAGVTPCGRVIERYLPWIGLQRHFQGGTRRGSTKCAEQRREQ